MILSEVITKCAKPTGSWRNIQYKSDQTHGYPQVMKVINLKYTIVYK